MSSSECLVSYPGRVLLGREREIGALRALAQGGTGTADGALVLRGEAGAGKTALLAEFTRCASGRRVLRLAGIAAEADMAWAALHRLLLTLPAELDRLPGGQRAALDAAVGLRDGAAPDARLVNSIVRAVLADAAQGDGLVCVVDDLQWIDRESLAVLHDLARRAAQVPLVLVAAVREPAPAPALAGVPELTVAGLTAGAGAELLLAQAGDVLDRRTAERLALLAGGNPQALAETGRRLAAGQADVTDILCGQRLPGRSLPEPFVAEVRALPEASRALLALAACDTGGDPGRLRRAGAALGLGPRSLARALAPARRARVVRPGRGVEFRHPLLRAAVLDLAPSPQCRAAHQALAAACDQQAEPGARVWHRAGALAGQDEEIAAALAAQAEPAGSRDPLAVALWLARAARLSATRTAAADRYLAASAAALAASAPRLADELLRHGPAAADTSARQATAQRLAARLSSALGRPAGDSGLDMLISAGRLAVADRRAGLEAMQEAAQLALVAGHYSRGTTPRAIGLALLHMAEPESGGLLPGLATLLSGDFRRAVPLLRAVLRADRTAADALPGAGAARIYAARALWDDEYLLTWAGPAGGPALPGAVPTAPGSHDQAATLASWSAALAGAGHLGEAEWLARRGRALALSGGWSPALLATLDCAELHAWRGDESATQRAASRQAAAAAELERADIENSATAALMTLHLSQCQYAQACAAAEQLASADLGGYASAALSVLVEAGSRLGQREAAGRALDELRPRARASGTTWALGVLARCEALLAGDDDAPGGYEQAITLLDATSVVSERAHARLLYGEWLRRKRQRTAARTWLDEASRLFRQMGAVEFARRAERELEATLPPGQRPGRPAASAAPALTLAERRIAELAAAGATNKEIAAELFVSRRTVDHHLRNTYGKLGVSSRRQLGAVLPRCSPESVGSRA